MKPNPALLSAVCLIPLMATAALAQNAGITAAVNQQAAGTPPGGSVRTIVLGDNVIQNERIDTSADGLVQILLADGTAFTVGPNSSLSIDRFVYDPGAGNAQVAATLTQGVFRFIGGRTSKTPGGVVLNTPVGTAGIRGAIVDIILDPGSNGTVAEFAMRFGQDVTLTRCEDQTRRVRVTLCDGAERRVFQPGYSIVVGGNGRVAVVPTPPGSASAIQSALAGRPGTTGGAPVSPTNPTVAESPVPGANSEQPIVVIAAPVPTPRPEPIARPQEIVVADATRDEIRGVIERSPEAPPPLPPEEPPVGPDPEPPVEPEPPVTPEPPVEPEPGEPGPPLRVFRGPNDIFVTSVADAETTTAAGRLRTASGDDVLDLPVLEEPTDDGDGTPIAVSGIGTEGGQAATLGGRALRGAGYAGREGFRAYLMQAADGAGDLVFAFTGLRTDVATVFGPELVFDGESELPVVSIPVRAYSLLADPIFGGAVPFARDRGLTVFPGETSSIGQLFVTGSENPASGTARMMQASLVIDGRGPGQRSQVVLNVGAIIDTGDGLGLSALRRGGENVSGLANYLGGLSTLNGPGGGDGFFGSNGEYLALTGAGGSGLRERGGPEGDVSAYQRTQIGSLQSVATIGDRRDGTLLGFSSGIAVLSDDGTRFTRLRSESLADTNVAFDAVGNGISSSFNLAKEGFFEPIDGLSLVMGGENGPSAFVSNDIYAASATDSELVVSAAETTLQTSGEVGSYLISGRSVPIAGIDPFGLGETRCTECDFIEWGWWGTQGRGSLGGGPATVDVHLGNWIAGEVTDNLAISELAGLGASYSGGALGTVVSGGQTYIAAGDMNMNVSFGSRTGSLSISGFDGRTWGTDINFETSDGQFQGSGGGLVFGSTSGAFVNGPEGTPAGGVIGNFGIEQSGGDWRATGIFGGGQTFIGPEA